jgi:hypothetical protein
MIFFAARNDPAAVFQYLFAETDARVFEAYSECSQELREFRSVAEVEAAAPLGQDPHGNSMAMMLYLWPPAATGDFRIERIAVNPEYCEGHTFRFTVRGAGLLYLTLGGVCEQVVTQSKFGQASIFGDPQARQTVKKEAVAEHSRTIRRHIATRLAVVRAGMRPVLPQALELARMGYALKRSADTPRQYDLTPLPMPESNTPR